MELTDKKYLTEILGKTLDNKVLDYLLKEHQDFLTYLRAYHEFSKEKRELSVEIGTHYLSIKDELKRDFKVELPQKFISLTKLEKLNSIK